MKTTMVNGGVIVSGASSAAATQGTAEGPLARGPQQQRGAEASAIEPGQQQAGPTTGGAAQRAAASGGKRVAGAKSPSLGRAGADAFVTYYLFTTKADQRMDMLPDAVTDKITALKKKHPDDFREMPATQVGSDLFASDVVLKVRASLAGELNKLVQANKDAVAVLELGELLAVRPSGKAVDAATIAALKSKQPGEQLRALLDLHASLPAGLAGLSAAEKKELAFGISGALSTYSKLFNSVLLEESRPRRVEIIEARKQQPKSIGEHFSGYLNASAQAIAELRERGGTPELTTTAAILTKSADLLAALDTPLSLGLLERLLNQADGMLLGHVAKQPATVKRLVEATFAQLGSGLAQTLAFMETPKEARGKDRWLSSSSGGLEFLSSRRYQHESLSPWSESYPFSELSANFALLLGTPGAADARDAVRAFMATADAAMPRLIELHKANYLREEMGQYARMTAGNGVSAEDIKERQDAAARSALERYPDRQLTGTAHVALVDRALGYSLLADSEHYSRKAAFAEKVELVTELLGTLKSPELREALADTGIGLFVLSTQDRALASDAAGHKRIAALVDAITAPSLPEPTRTIATVTLAGRGAVALLPRVVDALSDKSDTVHGLAMNTLECFAAVASGNLEGVTNKAAFENMGDGERAALRKGLDDAIAGITALAEGAKTVWARMNAAGLLARLGMTHGASIDYLREMLSPKVVGVYFGDDHLGAKNIHVRLEAAKTLGAFGARAAAALPDLEVAARQGAAAAKLVAAMDEARKQAGGRDYHVEYDASLITEVKALLAQISVAGSTAAAALAFIEDPKGVDLNTVRSYERDRYPSAEGAIREAASLGEAARKASEQIKAG